MLNHDSLAAQSVGVPTYIVMPENAVCGGFNSPPKAGLDWRGLTRWRNLSFMIDGDEALPKKPSQARQLKTVLEHSRTRRPLDRLSK